MNERVGMIGAGAMGSGIAKNLVSSGYPVLAYKRHVDMHSVGIQKLRSSGVSVTDDMHRVFTSSDVLMLCLPDSPTVEQVLMGDRSLMHTKVTPVSCVLDFSTSHPQSTRMIAHRLAERNIAMLDTPMTGGPAQAESGNIRLAVGGDQAVLERYRPLLESVSEKIVYAGEHGNGNTLKLVNNFLAILSQTASAEVAILMQHFGITHEALREFVSVSGGNSWGFQMMMQRIMHNSFDVNFALDLAHKDLKYTIDLFAQVGGSTILCVLEQLFSEAEDRGFGSQDVGAIYHSLGASSPSALDREHKQ